MRVSKKRISVLIIFSLTLVSILAGVGYAQWKDSVKLNIKAETWNFELTKLTDTYTNGSCTVSNDINSPVITSTVGDIHRNEEVTLVYTFRNDSTVPIKIDDIYFSTELTDLRDGNEDHLNIRMLADVTSSYSSAPRPLDIDETYAWWEGHGSTEQYIGDLHLVMNDPGTTDDELTLVLVVSTDGDFESGLQFLFWYFDFWPQYMTNTITIEYSVYE